MTTQAQPFWIGLFVLGSLALIVGGIVAVTTDELGADAILMETYLDESVMGLSVGSELTHRGVPIGRVKTISFVPIAYEMPVGSAELERYGRYIMVVLAVDPRKVPGLGDNPQAFRRMMEEQVGQGLRLKLTYQGITGLAVLQTEYVPADRIEDLAIGWTPKHLYIPSTPSTITSFTEAVDNVFQRLERIDFEALVTQVNETLVALEKEIEALQLAKTRESILAFLDGLATTNVRLQALVVKAESLADREVPEALREFSTTLGRVERLLGRHEPDLDGILVDLRRMAANLRQLSESLKSDPAQIILSRPPERSEVVQ